MHVIVSGIGSSGDVNPFVEISRELVTRGHSVDFITSEYFEEKLRLSNLNFLKLGTREEFVQIAADPEMWHPRLGFRATWRAIKPYLQAHCALIAEHYKPGETVLLNSTIAMGGRLAQDKLCIPAATVHLAPSCIMSADAPPHFPVFSLPPWLPLFFRRIALKTIDRFALDSECLADMNAVRKELDLLPVSSVMLRWIHSPDLVIGAFPEWFAHPQKDWPANCALTGFPVHRTIGRETLSSELEAFLKSGSAPVLFTAGSAMGNAREHFKKAAKVVGLSNVRAIFVCAFPEQVRDVVPPNSMHIEYAPFDQLLPRTAAIVHHGGIGTAAQALAAGIKQLVIPLAHDQFDNADRLKAIGVGDVGSVTESAEKQAKRLIDLLNNQNATAATARYKQLVENGPDPRVEICRLLEDLHARRSQNAQRST